MRYDAPMSSQNPFPKRADRHGTRLARHSALKPQDNAENQGNQSLDARQFPFEKRSSRRAHTHHAVPKIEGREAAAASDLEKRESVKPVAPKLEKRSQRRRAQTQASAESTVGAEGAKVAEPVKREPPSPSEMKEIYGRAMNRALFLANRAREGGDVPVGAVVIDEWGNIVAEGWNVREAAADPVGHAEVMALREAAKKKGTWRLDDLTLVVTLEPCTMCAGAIVNSRVKRLVFGAWDEKAGAAGSLRDVVRDSRLNHQPEVVTGILQTECEIQLRGFFSTRRSM